MIKIILICYFISSFYRDIKSLLKTKVDFLADNLIAYNKIADLKKIVNKKVYDIIILICCTFFLMLELILILLSIKYLNLQFYTYFSMFLIILNGLDAHHIINNFYRDEDEILKICINNYFINKIYMSIYFLYDLLSLILLMGVI